jgi:hypothetical protein
MGTRLRAQQLIVENKISSITNELKGMLKDRSLEDKTGLNNPVVHSIWTLKGLNKLSEIDAVTIKSLFSHPSGAVRKNAIMALKNHSDVLELVLDNKLIFDPDVLVRREALLALLDSEVDPEILYQLAQDTTVIQHPGLSHATYFLRMKRPTVGSKMDMMTLNGKK